ncbi:enoyl-CoA hydratase/isomerase family protein [Sphingopyxis sp.]|uniref:enoyl-CoA hydratase/isomerase family protein n=1 Tax=Sphingopyxis sp. TaxID=1908224 RepID=UPI001DF77079|nr:enoyl-CoA hydratase/isomerase family protein [Sphingopyxis sp.]MBW8297071.1 enoyl-CoA hydratase/isomerase family protein [Sphingopyxis sp.]
MTDALVLRDDADGVCTLTLNRPAKRNAVNRALFREFRAHIRDIEANDSAVGVIVVTGAGGHFCAGHDLKQPPHADALGWLRQEMLILERLTKLPQPVIAKVSGSCYTGGLEFALSADFIVCDPSARFADTHGKWGLVPGWGLSQRLPRRVGQAKALEMMLTCQPYSGEDAAAMGLANYCVTEDALDAKVAELAALMLGNSRHSSAENKRLIYDTDGMALGAGLSHELMRNAGFDPAMRKKGEPIGRAKKAD